tara:strand:+ start:2655 stop:2756 length:102 start_codon:yes stop_codon:yes gene_type:complete
LISNDPFSGLKVLQDGRVDVGELAGIGAEENND